MRCRPGIVDFLLYLDCPTELIKPRVVPSFCKSNLIVVQRHKSSSVAFEGPLPQYSDRLVTFVNEKICKCPEDVVRLTTVLQFLKEKK
jgi:hypothetical protein